MPNDYFSFKQFTIQQADCAMKVGTDGVLLGAWAPINNVNSILDVGTGTGLIALQLAQRQPHAKIQAIEIDPIAAKQAKFNVDSSPWADRVAVICQDFKLYQSNNLFDLIVSNPPYFVDALRSPNEQRSMARHTNQLNYEVLFSQSSKLLHRNGHLCIIIPSEVGELVLDTAWKYGFHPCRQVKVYTKPEKACRRWLLSFAFGLCECEHSTFFIHQSDGSYTSDYQQLTSDFYLYF